MNKKLETQNEDTIIDPQLELNYFGAFIKYVKW